jgi:hypothetical protein
VENYVETTFNIQRRMADYHFSVAESWPELLKVHEEWVSDYNEQSHWAHRERKDGRRSPQEVLGWVTGVRYRPEDLERAFFSIRFSRMLDPLGYATFRRWRLYGQEALAGSEAALWLQEKSLTIEHASFRIHRRGAHFRIDKGEGHDASSTREVKHRSSDGKYTRPEPSMGCTPDSQERGRR